MCSGMRKILSARLQVLISSIFLCYFVVCHRKLLQQSVQTVPTIGTNCHNNRYKLLQQSVQLVPTIGTNCHNDRYKLSQRSVQIVTTIGTNCSNDRYKLFQRSVQIVPTIGTNCSNNRYKLSQQSVQIVPSIGTKHTPFNITIRTNNNKQFSIYDDHLLLTDLGLRWMS
jgi:hypothetical protein